MMKKMLWCCIIMVCGYPSQVFAADTARIVQEGNRSYKEQKYDDALKSYSQALSRQPDSVVINFDMGAAQYKTHEYGKAAISFEKALVAEDKRLEARAHYNLGNSKYMLGVSREDTDLSGAVQALEGALNNYSGALQWNSKDEDARINLAITEKKLKELKEKLRQQPQKNNSNSKQQGQNKDQQQQEGQQNQEDKKAEQGKQEEDKKQNEPSDQGRQQQQEQQAGQQQEQQAGQQEQEASKTQGPQQAASQPQVLKEMSQEEAHMLLESFRQKEDAGGMLKDDRKGTEARVKKDW